MEEIKEILHDPIINRDKKIEKIEEIKKILYDPRNNLYKPEKYHYKPVQMLLVMLLVATIFSIKAMETKIKHYQLKIILMKLKHI